MRKNKQPGFGILGKPLSPNGGFGNSKSPKMSIWKNSGSPKKPESMWKNSNKSMKPPTSLFGKKKGTSGFEGFDMSFGKKKSRPKKKESKASGKTIFQKWKEKRELKKQEKALAKGEHVPVNGHIAKSSIEALKTGEYTVTMTVKVADDKQAMRLHGMLMASVNQDAIL